MKNVYVTVYLKKVLYSLQVFQIMFYKKLVLLNVLPTRPSLKLCIPKYDNFVYLATLLHPEMSVYKCDVLIFYLPQPRFSISWAISEMHIIFGLLLKQASFSPAIFYEPNTLVVVINMRSSTPRGVIKGTT